MISSVRRGLEAERDALPGLISALGHQSIRFEDFGAKPVPSREACLRAVNEADLYLLMLGPHYGHVFAETGQSATHDEFIAAQAKGIPRIVMRKTGVTLDPEQEDFSCLVGDYGAGVFYDTFTDATDLQAKVVRAIRQAEQQPTPLSYIPLQSPVAVEWRRDWPSTASGLGLTACLEIHIVPVPPAPLSGREMDGQAERLLSSLRTSGAVSAATGLEVSREPSGAVVIRIPAPQRRSGDIDPGTLQGIRLGRSGQMSLCYTLPRDKMALAVLDPDDLAARIAEALRLAGRLGLVHANHVAVATGVDPASLITVDKVARLGTRTSATFARSGQIEQIHIDPDEAVTLAALDLGATDVGWGAAQRLITAAS
jgi:hypothetical protein